VPGTCDWGLYYPKRDEEQPVLVGFSDSDLAGDVDRRKSTTGLIFFLGKSPMCWQSSRYSIVAMSSCEAEYIVVATACCQAVWLARLAEILDREIGRPILHVDNKSAISLVKNPVLNERSRHIDTRFHLIREYEASGQISVAFIRTDEQLGDILKKALSRIKFQELCGKIGLHMASG
jgi:hypothetical protein